MTVIDASNIVFGRLASIVAERALKDERIDIVNAEKSIIIGHKNAIVKRFKGKLDLKAKGNPEKGPKFSRTPDRMMHRAIRGMLPKDRERGKKALKRVRVFIGVPKKLEGEKMESIRIAAYNGKEEAVKLGDVGKALGWKWSM